MRILIAPDKFKGSMSAGTVASILAETVRANGHESTAIPIADGGEGTTEVLCEVLSGRMVSVEVRDALGRTVTANYAVKDDLAVMEMSAASGLWRIEADERDPWVASTFGTGQMIRDAIEYHSAARILIGIGGSATNDGGAGMAQALGYRFLDRDLCDVVPLPVGMDRVTNIRRSEKLPIPQIDVACDVDNPLLGEKGATRVYGSQKGVSESDFDELESRLAILAAMAEKDLGVDSKLKDHPGAGAAGGLGYGLMAFCGAELRPGFKLIADLLGLRKAIAECDAVITGEGKLDVQTLNGKGPHGVARWAREAGKPVLAVVGDTDDSLDVAAAFEAVIKIRPPEMSVADSMRLGPELLKSERVRDEISSFLKKVANEWA